MRFAALLLCIVWVLGGQELAALGPWPVTHERALWPDAEGTLSLDGAGLRFARAAKKDGAEKALALGWNDIQQLTLSEGAIEVVSYRDVRWQLGRDRQFRFEMRRGEAGDGSFAAAEAALRRQLGSRLVVALGAGSGEGDTARWELAAKRSGLLHGVEGTLAFTGAEVVFRSAKAEESRRWLLSEIETIAQTNPYSFTVTVPERALADQGGYRSFSFQLKQPLSEARYQELWRAVERAHGTRLRFRDALTAPGSR
jgi:hypothetical protein